MSVAKPDPAITEKLRSLRPPRDYFAGARSSLPLWPERILCFTRRNHAEAVGDSLARYHHHRHVLIVPWEGAGTVYVDDRRFALSPQQSLLIFPFQFHHGFDFDQSRVLWLFVTFEMPPGSALETLQLQPQRLMQAEDHHLLGGLIEAWQAKGRQNELAPWLALFLNRMLEARAALPVRRGGDKPSRSSSLLRRINQQCMPHLDEAIGLKGLAARMAISESYLRARFRKETGMSLGQHLRRLRLQKSMTLLLQSELSISQIAEKCGFDSIFAFSRSFHRFAGMRATDYRERFVRK